MAAGSLASGLPIARIFGITVRIHVTWLVIFLLLTFSLATFLLPLSSMVDGGPWWQGRDISVQITRYMHAYDVSEEVAAHRLGVALWPRWQYWVLGAIGSLGLFVCVLAHELSHSVVAMQVGIPVEGITLFIFGGMARIGGEAKEPGDEFKVAAAGPLMSLALGVGAGLVYYGAGEWLGWLSPQAQALMHYFMFINLVLMAFNLVPGFPLDGGRLLRAMLWKLLGDFRQATYVASWFGRGVAGLLIAVGVLEFLLIGFDLGALWWVIIGMFLWQAAKGSYQQVQLRDALAGLTVRDVLETDVTTVSPDLTVEELVRDYFYRRRRRSFPVVENGDLVGLVRLKDVRALPQRDWPVYRVRDATRRVDPSAMVGPDDDLETVFHKLMQADGTHLPVVENGRLVGVVTRHDLMNLLEIRTDLGPGG